jgi:hypothetical protein
MKNKIKVSVIFTRSSNGIINLTVEDKASSATFLEVEFKPEQFANSLTGLFTTEVDARVQYLGIVGKNKIREQAKIKLPDFLNRCYDREKIREYLVNNCQRDGWILDDYLGARGSITYNEDQTESYANISYIKYV